MLPTCGELCRTLAESLLKHPLLDAAPDRDFACFAMGFASGQAEKVYNGACPAFMIRPAPDWYAWAWEMMCIVCTHYDLGVVQYVATGEIWAYGYTDGETQEDIHMMLTHLVHNDPRWHEMRARLCGIPKERVDTQYHKRTGYQVRCEPVEKST